MKNTMKTMKLGLHTLASSLLFAAMAVAPLRAQNPPPGWIFQLAGQGQGVLSTYQQYTTTFVATSNQTYVSFGFREVPDFFAFDDASVTDVTHPSGNLLTDPGFEGALLNQEVPTGWGRWIQPIDTSFVGLVAGTGGSACAPNGPHGGSGQFWCDGSVQGYDGLFQQLATTPGDHYTVSFWLGDNSNQVPVNPTIDMFVWAGDSLPSGTEPLPEPSSLALFGTGALGLAGVIRRKLKA